MTSVTTNAQNAVDDMDTARTTFQTFADSVTDIPSPDGTGDYSTLVMLNLDETNSNTLMHAIDMEIDARKQIVDEFITNIQSASDTIDAASADFKTALDSSVTLIEGFENLIVDPAVLVGNISFF